MSWSKPSAAVLRQPLQNLYTIIYKNILRQNHSFSHPLSFEIKQTQSFSTIITTQQRKRFFFFMTLPQSEATKFLRTPPFLFVPSWLLGLGDWNPSRPLGLILWPLAVAGVIRYTSRAHVGATKSHQVNISTRRKSYSSEHLKMLCFLERFSEIFTAPPPSALPPSF